MSIQEIRRDTKEWKEERMSKNVLSTTLSAIACAAVVSAQAPQTPQAPPTPSQQPPAPAQRAPEAKPAAADAFTVIGCVEKRADASSATPGTVGTTGATRATEGPGFILTKAMKPAGAAGASSAAAATSYRLDAEASKLTGHVGHKVEITGTVSDRAASASPTPAGASSAAPLLKVENVKMIAATCTE